MDKRISAWVLVGAASLAMGGCASNSKCAGDGGAVPTTPPADSAAVEQAPPPVSEAKATGPAKTIVFVRHAEKASDGTQDPPLTPEGEARAKCLATMMSTFEPDHVLTSPYLRTRSTVAPLAEQAGITPTAIDPRDGDAWIAALQELPPGSRTVVAGHSNTIPQLIAPWGATVPSVDEHGNIPHDEYDWMVVLVVDADGDRVSSHTVEYCTH